MTRLGVAFDVSSLLGVRTGIAAAVEQTLTALRAREDLRVRTFAFGARVVRPGERLPGGTRRIPAPTRALVRSWSGPRGWSLDRLLPEAAVVHMPAFVAPPSRLPMLITVHDCAFALHPETTDGSVHLFEAILRRAVDRGAWVHCSTEAVGAEVEDVFGAALRAQGRVVVAPFGVPPLGGGGVVPPGVADRLGDDRLVVAIGALGRRKNLPRLVGAFGGIAAERRDVRLVLAGPDGPDRPAIDASIAGLSPEIRARVLLPGAVDAAARRGLLERAAVLAYPSLYEGFGFPMLEAMWSGTPVLAGDVPALREVAGDAAVFADPLDEADIAGALARLLDDPALGADLVARGRERAALFTWERTAAGLADAYRALSATS